MRTGSDDEHVFKVNVSPAFSGHCLYIPFITKCLPQVIHSIDILTNLMQQVYPEVCLGQNCLIGFNSIGAFSSINHLHFQIIPLA
jgi:hypothetical protein